MSTLLIRNGRIITPEGIIPRGSILSIDGVIRTVSASESVADSEAVVVDAEGQYVAPGCIDLHVHGAAGHDFMEATPEAFDAIRRTHALHGTTSLLGTLAVSSPDIINRCIDICDRGESRALGAELLGLHLEGNYLNPIMKGAQDPTYISNPDPEEYTRLLSRTHSIRRWSAAPELPGALDFARYARRQGVLVALAHTTADYAQVQAAYEAGFTHATHFYNAMTTIHKEGIRKHEGTVEAVLLTDGITVEVIADGIHVPPTLLQLVYKVKGPDNIALVTDALRWTELSDAADSSVTGNAGGQAIVSDGVCLMSDGSALAGSIATTDRLIRTMVQQAAIPLTEAIRMASATPARILGIHDRKGTLTEGKDADIIFLDDTLHVTRTFVHGNEIG